MRRFSGSRTTTELELDRHGYDLVESKTPVDPPKKQNNRDQTNIVRLFGYIVFQRLQYGVKKI